MSEGKPKWMAWALGIGGTLVTALLLWIVQFFAFGFEEYVKEVAGSASPVDPVVVSTMQTDIADIKATLVTEAERDQEWREQQAEDMRNLIQIISTQ
jgi:hypothetical protein